MSRPQGRWNTCQEKKKKVFSLFHFFLTSLFVFSKHPLALVFTYGQLGFNNFRIRFVSKKPWQCFKCIMLVVYPRGDLALCKQRVPISCYRLCWTSQFLLHHFIILLQLLDTLPIKIKKTNKKTQTLGAILIVPSSFGHDREDELVWVSELSRPISTIYSHVGNRILLFFKVNITKTITDTVTRVCRRDLLYCKCQTMTVCEK